MPAVDKFKDKYRIPSARLKEWDYSEEGIYSVTICVKDRKCCLGDVDKEGEVILSPMGEIVKEELLKMARLRHNVILDEWVIMPNHVHFILEIVGAETLEIVEHGVETRLGASIQNEEPVNTAETRRDASIQNEEFGNMAETRQGTSLQNAKPGNKFGPLPRNSLPSIVNQFKGAVVRSINQKYGPGKFAWQPRYYDHVIADEKEYDKVAQYILDNPGKWAEDKENPVNFKDEE